MGKKPLPVPKSLDHVAKSRGRGSCYLVAPSLGKALCGENPGAPSGHEAPFLGGSGFCAKSPCGLQ